LLYLYRIRLVCIPGLKKDKRSWLDLRLTFLYTSSTIVEEPKTAVLSKTKPNKPREAGRVWSGCPAERCLCAPPMPWYLRPKSPCRPQRVFASSEPQRATFLPDFGKSHD